MSTFLLVHGGMLGGWCWKKVRKHLESKNHLVLTPTLTGLGERKHLINPNIDLDVHINDILNVIHHEDLGKVTLVGHSYGGMVITGACDNIPEKIQQLVYIDALIPQNGESMFDIIDPKIATSLFNQAQEKGNGWQVPPPHPSSYNFENPLDAEWVAFHSTPHPLKSFQQQLSLKNPLKISNSHYINCTRTSFLDSMMVRAKNMGFLFSQIDSGHFPMVTEPKKLSELILRSNK